MSKIIWVVYLVRCSDNALYCGVTSDLRRRLMDHNSGKGAKYTRSRRPVALVGVSAEMTKGEALKLEYRIKRLPADKKLFELTGKENRMTLKQDLKKLQNEINRLEKNLAKLTKAMATIQKPESRKARKPKAPPAERAKETAAETAATKMTATDQVLDIIKKAENGVDAGTLMKKTGFKDQKIRNILTRIFKEGRVKRVGRGVYVMA
jgi:putative endonuclease